MTKYGGRKRFMLLLASFFLVAGLIFGGYKLFKYKYGADTSRAATSGTYYVAINGKNEAPNDGTIDLPWLTVEYALSQVGGGNTIIIKSDAGSVPANFYGPITIDSIYAGTELAPTIIKSQDKWKARVIGSLTNDIIVSADWVIIDGIEILGARNEGINIQGNNSVIKNCWIHSNSQSGAIAQNRTNITIERNLIEFNGHDLKYHHGIYADGEGFLIRNNIIRHNSASGIYLYPNLVNSHVEENVLYSNEHGSGISVFSPVAGGNNTITNNTIAKNKNGITLSGGSSEIVTNNIFKSNIVHTSGSSNALALNNAASDPMTTDLIGPNSVTITADPAIIKLFAGAYFLWSSSPVINAGNASYLPVTDFWGRPQPAQPYIGAFPYEARLTDYAGLGDHTGVNEDIFYLNWYSGWGYSSYLIGPDYWNL